MARRARAAGPLHCRTPSREEQEQLAAEFPEFTARRSSSSVASHALQGSRSRPLRARPSQVNVRFSEGEKAEILDYIETQQKKAIKIYGYRRNVAVAHVIRSILLSHVRAARIVDAKTRPTPKPRAKR